MQTMRDIRTGAALGDPLDGSPTPLSYRREVAARARTVITDLHESGRGFVSYDTLRSPIDGRFAFSDVRDAVDRVARRQGIRLEWFGCDDIGMAVDVADRD
jgi:hypothetical protein